MVRGDRRRTGSPNRTPPSGSYNLHVKVSRDALAAALLAEPDVRLAVLFGSASRSMDGPASDLDVGVVAEASTVLAALAVRLERATGRRVDLVNLVEAPPLLRFEVARDGVVLLERQPHLWSDIKARALIDWWDWAPTARMFSAAAAARLRRQVSDGPA